MNEVTQEEKLAIADALINGVAYAVVTPRETPEAVQGVEGDSYLSIYDVVVVLPGGRVRIAHSITGEDFQRITGESV